MLKLKFFHPTDNMIGHCTHQRSVGVGIEHEHLAPKENNVKSERASARFGSRYAERGELWSHRTIAMREKIARLPNNHKMDKRH